jgi:hypothetical protein
VGLGYRVIEEYLQQGRRTAEALGPLPGAAAAGEASFQALSARLLRDGLTWLEQLAKMSATPAHESAPPRAAGVAGIAAPGGFRVRASCAAALEVDLRLEPGVEGRPLAVHDLRSSVAEHPPLADPALTRAERWELSLRVPDAQPPGLYTGIVYDLRDGAICGTLAVRVGAADESS